jgi:uncharacterized circularly permuted ATP-grasp superfamily protein/uncharacterized alpha-E superfamily protein
MTTSTDPSALPPSGRSADWLGYESPAGAPDEAFDGLGKSRPHWATFVQSLREMGLNELTHRWDEAKQLVHENGVTYNVYGDPRGMERPWQLDPIPILISSDEAAVLEAGLIQRGRLLEALLRDLYGPQQALALGLLPPELIYANPGFFLCCHGFRLPENRWVHLYAANVGRGADGTFHVLGDRTQSPSGAGYALENRIVLARTLPDTFRVCRVQRLALFFRALRDTLRAIAPRNHDNPRIVLLTPGPYNETYFEHAYLARYLGYTLAEGGDLTVRDNRVYLKVLGGLQPVDVIFRRLDDDFCDPLELRPDSFLGVPALVQAVRTGNVAVANALGSGLLETPALLAFLPRLCRHFLGEELRLPSVPTWWCGDPAGLDHVLAGLRDMVVKPALAATRMEPVFGDELSREQRERLIEKIKARPSAYVGQERLALSTAPVLIGNRLRPRHLVLRAYAAAQGDSYTVMPGGLARFSGAPGTMVVSMQRGGGSKDTWVLSEGPISTFSLLPPPGQPVELTRGGHDLPSRVADNLFWLGRYAERAEGLARLLRGVLVRLTERSGLAESPELPVLLRAVTVLSAGQPGFVGTGAEERLAAPEAEIRAVIHDPRRPASLATTLTALSRLAGIVRDRISSDMWRVLRDVGDFRRIPRLVAEGSTESPAAANGRGGRTLSDELDLLDQVILTLAAFGGLAMDSVTRGEGWRFLDMGRKLERCLHILGLVYRTLSPAQAQEGPLLEALLEIADSSMTYRRRYQASVQTVAVLDLLLADETNPRALVFQMAALADDVDHLPREPCRPGRSIEQQLMLSSLTGLRLADVERLARVNNSGRRPELEDLLSRLALSLPALSDAITQTYLSHLETSRHLIGLPTAPPLTPDPPTAHDVPGYAHYDL